MEHNEEFRFTYSAARQQEIERIRSKYLPKEEDKMDRLRKLHHSATRKANSASIAVGVIGALVLGWGMSLCMTELGAGLGEYAMVVGILIGVAGMILTALAGVTDAGEKERIIFQLLRQILRQETARHENIRLLIQGTNYSDVLKGSSYPLEPAGEGVSVIEPVRELFKDEVRHIGEQLGMSPAMLLRQPFPGSGLASRILSDVTPEKLAIVREADAIFRYEIAENNQGKRLWQYFAALAESPDPEGGYVVTLRAVQAMDGAGGMAARLPNDLLERVTLEILHRCPQVRRVLFDLTPSKSYTPVDTL